MINILALLLTSVERNLIKIYRELDDDSQCKFIDYAYELKAKLKSKLSKSKTIYNDETTSTSETEIA